MLSPEFHQALAPRTKVLNLIWGAFSVACVFYVAIAWVMFEQPAGSEVANGPAAGPGRMLPLIFAFAAMSMLAASFFVERLMLSPAKLAPHVQRTPVAEMILRTSQTGGSAPSPDQIRLFDGLSETEKRLAGLSGAYQTSQIIVWALREGIVVLGLVLAIMQGSFTAILPFAAVGFVTMLLKVPRPVSFYEGQLDFVRTRF
jgi:hypothetical protein